ncbi:MAG TPA: CmcJ/NvfI family oxidoreductase [Methylomirabilota bacterium]|nr:CmcJ/NvfI family oxidoreductase [Methylomirabilota bacterium]
MDGDRTNGRTYVTAPLQYMIPMAVKPRSYAFPPPAGVPVRTSRYAEHPVPVRDGRAVLGDLSLDGHGFALLRHRSAVTDFYDAAQLKAVYLPEVERLVAAATGAAKVVAFDQNLRSSAVAGDNANGVSEPAWRVHNDYTERSGPQRVRDLLDLEEADFRLRHRFAVINLWRPIKGPLLEAPLALCDARSMAAGDFVANDLIYPDRVGETYAVTFNPGHRWFYFPRMQTDEAILIKCYDSLDDGRARFTAHTAFRDPTTPADAPPRESIEVRTLAFFDPEEPAGVN